MVHISTRSSLNVLARALSDEHNAWLIFGTMKVGDAATCALFDGLPDWLKVGKVVVERRYPSEPQGLFDRFFPYPWFRGISHGISPLPMSIFGSKLRFPEIAAATGQTPHCHREALKHK